MGFALNSCKNSGLIGSSLCGISSRCCNNILYNTAVATIVFIDVLSWVRIPTARTGNLLFHTPKTLSITFLVAICALYKKKITCTSYLYA